MARRGSFIEKVDLDATGFKTDDLDLESTLIRLSVGGSAKRYDETLNNWKKPTTLQDCQLRVDPLRHHLQIMNKSYADTFVADEIIDFHNMTDVRSKPYTVDETKNSADWLVQPKDYDKFFMIAYYPSGHFDYVKVSFLSVLCKDEATANSWKEGLAALINYNTQWNSRAVTFQEKLARLYSASMAFAQPDANEGIPIDHVRDVFGKARRSEVAAVLKAKKMITKTKKAGKFVDSTALSPAVFEEIAEAIMPFKGMKQAFDRVTSKGVMAGYINSARLLKLLQEEHRDQRDNEILSPVPTADTVAALLETYETSAENREAGLLSFEGFKLFLLSKDGQAINPSHMSKEEDLSKPLSHYYINSSHNTYLLGGQLKSKSCAEIYRQTILGGCRCVELDAWDGEDGEPLITHGNTFCTKIPFKDAVDAIAEVAWVRSDLPIILSYENHCSESQQKKITLYTWGAFKDSLSSEFLAGDGPALLPRTLPSPEKMKRKVFIKNKRAAQDQIASKAGAADDDGGDGGAKQVRGFVAEIEAMEIVVDGELVTETEQEFTDRKSRNKTIAPELSAIVNYVWPIHFKGFEKAREMNCCYHMSSFNEKKAARFAAGQPEEFTDYCKSQIARIYPMGTRVNSTNYNPQIYWNVGAQLVALNFQTMGTAPLQINEGKFMVNRRCGYQLKPLTMRDTTKNFNPFASVPIPGIVAMDIKVEVLAAHFLGSSGNPQLRMQLVGLPHDTSKVVKSKAFRGDGEPVWTEDNVLEVSQVILPEIAILRISLVDTAGRDESLGWAAVPMDSLRPGYRTLPLRFAKSPLAYLLVKIDLKISNGRFADFADMLYNPTAYTSQTAENMAAIADLLIPDEADELAPGAGAGRRNSSSGAGGGGSSGGGPVDADAPPERLSRPSEFGGMSARPSSVGFDIDPYTQNARASTSGMDSFKRQLTEEMELDHKLTTGEALTYYRKMLEELDASKPVIGAKAAFNKGAAKLKTTYAKTIKSLTSEHGKKIASTFKAGAAKCKGKIQGAELDGARLEVHAELLQEIEAVATKMLADMEICLKQIDVLKVKLNASLVVARSKALKTWQAARMKRLKKLIKTAGAKAMQEAKDGMFASGRDAQTAKKETMKEWGKMQEEHNKDIVRSSVDANLDRAEAHVSQTTWLETTAEESTSSASDAHSTLIAKLDAMHVQTLASLKADEGKLDEHGWHAMTAVEFVVERSLPVFKTYSIAE